MEGGRRVGRALRSVRARHALPHRAERLSAESAAALLTFIISLINDHKLIETKVTRARACKPQPLRRVRIARSDVTL